MLCNSCKNKTSTERCQSKALKNLQFCGKHVKSKKPRLWSDVNQVGEGVKKIQKVWRGWIVRYVLSLAGPGVLKRSLCHNSEDVVTSEEKVHPSDYFAFHEDGKVFWFDIKSIFQLSINQLKPTNPYTRQEISIDARKRLKECIYYREVRQLPLFHDPLYLTDPDKVFTMRWMMISQMLEENLFIEVNPIFFTALNRTQVWEFTALLRDLILVWAKEHNNVHSRRNIYYIWVQTCWRRLTMEITTDAKTIYHYVGACLLKMMKDCKRPHDICFKILSARYNL